MSQENIELVRRATEAFSRGDFDGFLEDWAPDAVVDWSNSRGLDARVYRGHADIRAFAKRFREAFEDFRVERLDLVEVEDGSGAASRPRSRSTRRSRTPSKPRGCGSRRSQEAQNCCDSDSISAAVARLVLLADDRNGGCDHALLVQPLELGLLLRAALLPAQ
jgi:ketosteroid isomerase-like protein